MSERVGRGPCGCAQLDDFERVEFNRRHFVSDLAAEKQRSKDKLVEWKQPEWKLIEAEADLAKFRLGASSASGPVSVRTAGFSAIRSPFEFLIDDFVP